MLNTQKQVLNIETDINNIAEQIRQNIQLFRSSKI